MTGRAGRPPARLPNDVDLMSLSFELQDPRPGEMVKFRACWRLDRPLSGTLFALRLRPAGEEGSARGDEWDRFAPEGGYRLALGVAYSHPPVYHGWTELGEEAWLTVAAGPLPTNGP